MASPWREPGPLHPNGHLTWDEAADRLGVKASVIARWRDRGLPGTTGIDTFDLVNWAALHALHEVPALARRWRMFLAHFRPFVQGGQPARRIEAVRHQSLMGVTEGSVHWSLPRCAEAPGQHVLEDHIDGLEPVGAHHRGWAGPRVSGRAVLERQPIVSPLPDLIPLVEELVAGFTYGYRHHRPGEDLGERREGTCGDLSLALGARLSERGRPWRLVSGVVATSVLANPHFWIEVELPGGGWATIDPSLPALARMFADLAGDDWRQWARAYTGGRDTGVVILCRGESPLPVPGGASAGSTIGEALIDGQNAWPCLDWVCGECSWTFT